MRKLALALSLLAAAGCHPHWLLGVCEPQERSRLADAPVIVFQLDTVSRTVKTHTDLQRRVWVDTVCVPH